jgi:hypothetical protein
LRGSLSPRPERGAKKAPLSFLATILSLISMTNSFLKFIIVFDFEVFT